MSIRVTSDDLNPRPTKRLRHDSLDASGSCSATKTLEIPTPSSPISPPSLQMTTPTTLRRIPADTLLLSLPTFLIHPSTHPMHLQSLALARHALRRCLALSSLEPIKECRAWTGIAELGMMWLDTGASCLALGEVEQALTKALTISQRHPTLRLYTPHLTVLSARLAHRHQKNSKFAISSLRRLLATITSKSTHLIPLHVIFGVHLELIHCLACVAEEEAATSSTLSMGVGAAMGKCLVAIQAMRNAAEGLEPVGQPNIVVLLSTVIKLQLLVRHGVWASVGDALVEAETAFEAFDSTVRSTSSPSANVQQLAPTSNEIVVPIINPVPGTLRTHLLMLSVLFHTYAGDAQAASTRLKSLHELLDTGILESPSGIAQVDPLEGWSQGIIEIPFPSSSNLAWTPPLRIRTTPPRVLHSLAFLLSAVAKRDAVGRAPKKGVFARAGLELRELAGPFGGTGDGIRLARIKADLMCELISISIMRSDFPLSQSTLDTLTSYLRTHALFDMYAARVTLFHAQLAHARGETERARRCYSVAAFVAGEGRGGEMDEWVKCAARAGEVWVRIGQLRQSSDVSREGEWEELRGGLDEEKDGKSEMDELRKEGEKVAKECEGRGAALRAVGELLKACLAEEILKGKQHLRRALDLATSAQDNHLRALILALSASHYLHTAREHALTMLGTCGQLAAGLGAVPRDKGVPRSGSRGATGERRERVEDRDKLGEKGKEKGGVSVSGNVPLSLWVGERMVDLWRLEGDVGKAEGQEKFNERMRGVIEARRRGTGLG
ncbi:hypothetical protein E4T56_gene13334 [Termitomyces sp. T112]|nr:hypothetical protein E4T56_gene13334 [Termitomyces sp. T112]